MRFNIANSVNIAFYAIFIFLITSIVSLNQSIISSIVFYLFVIVCILKGYINLKNRRYDPKRIINFELGRAKKFGIILRKIFKR